MAAANPGMSGVAIKAAPTLRPVAGADRDRIDRWLQNPDVQRWWGNAASAEAEIRLALDSDASFCRIIETGGLPIGYAQAVDTGLTGAPLSARTHGGHADGSTAAPVPPGTWDCDLFIGSEPHRGQGYGQQALDLLVTEVFASTLALACMIVVPVRNERAARAYENVGFRWVAITEDPIHGACWVMLRERPRR